MAHPVVHWEIGGRDIEALRRFYGDMFDWKIDSVDPEYGLVETGDGMGGGIMRSRPGMPPHVTIYVEVDDIESALNQARELGGTPLAGPLPIENVGAFGLFSDPEGNIIGLLRTEEMPA